MSTFQLEILTPERQFFADEVQALTITTTDGELTVLKDHTPITVPLVVGQIKLKQNDVWKTAFQSEGFLEVDETGTYVFVQACEWPENIDARRATEAENRAKERMRQQKSLQEYQWTQVALTRAMARLRVINNKVNLD